MKMLIVMHSTNTVYGAGRSLLGWLNKIECEYDVLYPRSIFKFNKSEFHSKFEKNCGRIFSAWLPLYNDIKGREAASFKGKAYWWFNNVMFNLNKTATCELIHSSDYDVIYLNSLILYPLVNIQDRYVMHIREIFNGSTNSFKRLRNKMCQCMGVIFIDSATFAPFKEFKGRWKVLNNPFDMRAVANYDPCAVCGNEIDSKKTIFAVIGVISSLKGVERILNAFICAKVDAWLLIVGDDSRKYAQKLKKKYSLFDKIIFTGEVKEINKIYAITDVVIRGENQFCIGRTIYEGLYSGCSVIIPGNTADSRYVSEYNRFAEKVHFYTPECVEELTAAIKNLSGLKMCNRIFHSNIEQYTRDISNFIEEVGAV